MVGIKITDKLYDIVNKHPDIIKIMVELGFNDIVKPGMLNTAGRVMTIEKGAKMKNIPWDVVENKFKEYGYIIKKEEQR